MTNPLLTFENLKVSFGEGNIPAVSSCSFTIEPGKIVAVVGESGSGKSVTALSCLQLLPASTRIGGKILYSEDGQDQVNLLRLKEAGIRAIRGNKISMIFQEPMTSLNPVFTCGNQVIETILQHNKVSKKEARLRAIKLFEQVLLPEPETMLKRFPHQISGGQKQRVMIAMAMSCNPKLLIADEPTTALDVRVQKSILLLLKKLQQEENLSVLLITHDLALVQDVADIIIVMYKGEIVESGPASKVLGAPSHFYTKALLACKPSTNSKGKRLPVISDFMGDPQSIVLNDINLEKSAANTDTGLPLLSVQQLVVKYPASKNLFGKPTAFYNAVDKVSFDVGVNETVGLVGESGCGKTTLGRAILQLIKLSSGRIIFEGKELSSLNQHSLRGVRRELQVVFQDPYGSLNPRISIGEAITEPLTVHKLFGNKNERKEKTIELLEKVNLSPDHFNRYPHQFSGGQRQRICIARALVLNPSFLIFDESVSALDVSVQAQVLNLISDLKKEMKFTSIFISHDLSVVHYISDRILVMNNGSIVEAGTADQVYFNPAHEYTQKLINAIPGRTKFI